MSDPGESLNFWFDARGSLYRDPEGNPISLFEWTQLREDESVCRVGLDIYGSGEDEVRVSTVYTGICALTYGPPHVFETMIFGGLNDQFQARYVTREEADLGHLMATLAVELGIDLMVPRDLEGFEVRRLIAAIEERIHETTKEIESGQLRGEGEGDDRGLPG
jgi:hypothetical protein